MAGADAAPRYRAFISYSHRDATWGRRLHARLESYRLPRRLVGRATAFGPAPARLAPIFRDREELSAAQDLTAEVRAALQASASLIVVCSPRAQASAWVAREVEAFRSLNPGRPVLAALIEGEPSESLPQPMRGAGLDGAVVEPLAADFRKAGDGSRLALLKLVAGVTGLELDQLVQRDAQRRLRGVTAVTAGALAVALLMAGLAAFALRQRAEAEAQRAEAEGLIEFMLTDLRDRLEGVGRLDVLTAVNDRASAYYGDQDLARLSTESLERRARILHAMGEDDMKRGDMAQAAGRFEEARRTTAALLAEDPDNPARIYAHAQSAFWVAHVALRRGELDAARSGFTAYRRLAADLVNIDPDDPVYLREAAFAEGNLCTVALEEPPDYAAAERTCSAALDWMQKAVRRPEAPGGYALDLAHRHAWLSDVHRLQGSLEPARRHRAAEAAILARAIEKDPKNLDLQARSVALNQALGGIAFRSGDLATAREHLGRARATLDAMLAVEPANQDWSRQRRDIDGYIKLTLQKDRADAQQ